MDILIGHAAWKCNMDLNLGIAAWKCNMNIHNLDMQHGQAAQTSSIIMT
jgi:hypothetical protein